MLGLANIITGRGTGAGDTVNADQNSTESSEIPPDNAQNVVDNQVRENARETGEIPPVSTLDEEEPPQSDTVSEIPPEHEQVDEQEGATGGMTSHEEVWHQTPKVENTTGDRDRDVNSPTDLMRDITDGQQFMDDNLSDVMRNSAMASNLSSLLNITNTTAPRTAPVTMDWIIPDGLNSKLEEVSNKEIADFPVPGTNHGAMIVDIPNIEPYFNTRKYLVDLHTGDLFAAMNRSWHRLEVGCRKTGFITENVTTLLEHAGTRLRRQLQPIDSDQTAVLKLDAAKAKPPPIPLIPQIHGYQTHIQAMSPTKRKNYIKDRTQVALTYINEYNNTKLWELENKVTPESLRQRLQIVFGRTDAVREVIDQAIERDNSIRRKNNMRYLEAPRRFPTPDTMHRWEPVVWVDWIQEETQALIRDINEEIKLLEEEDDPFTSSENIGQQEVRNTKGTGEIPPLLQDNHPPLLEKLAMPLVPEKVNNPLPQRIKPQEKRRTGEIPPENQVQGKPPVHNVKSTRRQIDYDNMNMGHTTNNHNPTWETSSAYMQLPGDRQRTNLEQFSINGTPERKVCYRCGYEGHIKKYCNNQVYCEFCRTYSHHTSVCRSYSRYTKQQQQPVTSSRRNSPMANTAPHRDRPVEDRQPTEYSQTPESYDIEEEMSGITRKHLAQLIKAMIPSAHSMTTEGGLTNSINTQRGEGEKNKPEETEGKHVIVNNFYVPNEESGWKKVETGEIPPVNITKEGNVRAQASYGEPTQRPDDIGDRCEVREGPRIAYKEETRQHNLMDPAKGNYTPNVNYPPPPIPPTAATQQKNNETTAMLECMRQLQLTLQQHVLTNSRQTDYHMTQNADLFTEMIKAQSRRELDPAMMAIPTFSGTEPEKCMDWINRIRNVCEQSERSLRQELINKSEPVVQNFIRTLDSTWTDEEVIDEILKFFSDTPTPAHAITKLRALIQGENEPIVTFNQKYRTLLERVEKRPVDKIDSYVELEQYLGSIIFPIRKAIRGNIYWKSKHAPKNVGEAMKKAEELYMKHVYTTGGAEEPTENLKTREVTINEVHTHRPTTSTWKDRNTSEILPNRRFYEQTRESEPYRGKTGEISPEKEANKDYKANKFTSNNSSNRDQLPRGSYTQIMVNPTQLSDHEFTAWMDRLVEARKNRQNNKPRPYSQFRRPYTQQENSTLRNRIKPAVELNTEELMAHMRCEYVDIEEAVEMYNLDVEECRSA